MNYVLVHLHIMQRRPPVSIGCGCIDTTGKEKLEDRLMSVLGGNVQLCPSVFV